MAERSGFLCWVPEIRKPGLCTTTSHVNSLPHSHRIRPLDGDILSLVDLPNIAIPVCSTDIHGGSLPESESWAWEDPGGVIWAAPPPPPASRHRCGGTIPNPYPERVVTASPEFMMPSSRQLSTWVKGGDGWQPV